MRRRLIFSVSMTLIALCAISPARADILDLDVFKPIVDTDDLFRTKDTDERKRERRRDEDVDLIDEDDARRTDLRKDWTSDFQDTDFSKNTFRDFRDNPGDSVFDETTGDPSRDKKADGSDTRRDDKKEDSEESLIGAASTGAFSTDDDDWLRLHDLRRKQLRDERRMKDLTKPIPGALHDWVPSKVDRLQNGGFSIAEDNGSPVPYNLNGWVEIERDFPWGGSP